MKKKVMLGVLATTMALSMSMTALAGQWQSDANGWWYQNDNGSYPANTWQWIDGNNDGTAESYYFNEQGYCLMNTTTPDGYTVNPAGAWIVDGVVQTKIMESSTNQQPNTTITSMDLFSTEPVAKKNASFSSERRTSSGVLSNVILLSCHGFSNDGYIEYLAGSNYNTFTTTLYAYDLNDKLEYTLEVYGDNDQLLYKLDSLNYKTSGEAVSVDIAGQEYIKIVLHQVDGKTNGYNGILLKNAQFN